MGKEVNILFPHQLFEDNPCLHQDREVYLVEEFLFFKQYNFHKQKLAFHRASMKRYESFLSEKGYHVNYIEADHEHTDVRTLLNHLKKEQFTSVHIIDPTDNWLEKRIKSTAKSTGLDLTWYENPLFINTREDNKYFFKSSKKKFFQTSFYKDQRTRLKVLVEKDLNPIGGKWSFDAENRKKYPKNLDPPRVQSIDQNEYHEEAVNYVEEHFSENLGELQGVIYPSDFESSKSWLDHFLQDRFHGFGAYEDAIVSKESTLNHSVLTPMMNVGLLTPQYVLDRSLEYAEEHDTPINSVEGFVRQILGWREFIRGVYECKGSQERTTNYWGFTRKIPPSFYDGTTGVLPIDQTIQKVLKTGYCHHIERLMILGNFMLLNEFHPNEVYRWFMELFIDSYDWVMVTNVYGMSQFADGGLMATKPYISGSNYVMKMSDYKKGDWQVVWDALFWRFMDKQRNFFQKNPRLSMLIGTFDKMSLEKREAHLQTANDYLNETNVTV